MDNLNYQGGIYGIYYQNNLLYIGKTKRLFSERYAEHCRKLENVNSTEKFYQYCQQNNLHKHNLNFKILYDCNDCPLTDAQLECLETNYINNLKPLYNTKKIKQIDTIITLQKEKFPQLNEEQQKLFLYYYKNLSKSAFGLILGFLMFPDMNIDNYNARKLQENFDIKKTCFYDAIKEIKNL